jgi:signal transduction histidine kinase
MVATARDAAHLRLLRALGLRSVIIVPLLARGRTLGALSLVSAESGRSYTVDDVALAELLARRAALAVDNARLFEQVDAGRERLQALSRQLLAVQENERRHLARELHDQIGQTLTGLKLVLEMIERLPQHAFQERLGEARALVNELTGRVRELSLDLRPTILDDLGLLPALLWHFERFTAQTGVRIAFTHSGIDGRFAVDVETAAYRIVQEALTNVVRHAGVHDVVVSVWTEGGKLGVQIEDQGPGFDVRRILAKKTSSGVAGMRERARLLGGWVRIKSTPGHGTLLMAELPLTEPATARRG